MRIRVRPPSVRRPKGDQGARYLYSFISDEALASIGGRVKTLTGRRTTDVWLSKVVAALNRILWGEVDCRW